MNTNRHLDKSLRKSNKKKEDKVILLSGELGIPLRGQKLVEVPNRKGFVFVRLKNNTSELIQAYNSSVSPIYDLPVLVARQVGGYKVIGRNIDRYTNQWTNAPFLPKHGPQHSFNPSLNIGGDIVWMYSQQFMPLLGYPSGTNGSPQLAISSYIVRDLNGNWKYIGNTGTPDTTPYNPTTGSRAIMALVYLDTVSGNPYLLVNSGTYMDGSLTGTSDIAQYIPRITNPNWIPQTAIRLVSGTSNLTWDNLYDVRPFFQVIPTGSSSGGGGIVGIVAWDEGIPKGTGTIINFVGDGVTASVSGTVINVNIPGGGGGGGAGGLGFVGWDEGVYIATGTILNVTGQRALLSASGTVFNLNISPDPQELIGVYGLSNGIPLGTGTWIDFGNNLTASISGTTIRVDSTSSGGATGTVYYTQYIRAFGEQFSAASGTVSVFEDSAQRYRFEAQPNTVFNGQVLSIPITLKAGTYNFLQLGISSSDRGKVDWSVDNNAPFVSGLDWYSAAGTRNVTKTGTLTVPTDGTYILKATSNGKNASSSNFIISITAISLTRTVFVSEH